jgi:protoporphyrinogen oxidase
MAQIVIIGAGLTGLSAAYHFEKNGFYDYVILEKESTIGGLCRSIIQDGFTFDYTGHLLHINDPYFKEFIEDTIGLASLESIDRRSYIYSKGIYTHYPFQINLFGLPPEVITECISEYTKRRSPKRKITTFVDWVLSHFGAGFAKHFFFPFQQKIFDYDLDKVMASWTGRFVPSTSLEQMIKGALQPPQAQAVGYNAHFFYPKAGGINAWITAIANKLQNKPLINAEVTAIDTHEKKVIVSNGSTFDYSAIINTMPLDILVSRITGTTARSFKNAHANLVCNSVTNFNIGIKKADLSTKHWIYFPEPEIPFYRLGFPHNFAQSMAPRGCSSVYGEISSVHRPQAEVEDRLHRSLRYTQTLLAIEQTEILTTKVISIPHAYVIYNRWREMHLSKLLNTLSQLSICSTGRYGGWKYASMQEAVLDGKTAAQQLLPTFSTSHFAVSKGA